MKFVIQRVTHASVTVDGEVLGKSSTLLEKEVQLEP